MDWLTNWLPDLNYWAIICGALLALNIFQFAERHGTVGKLSGKLAHVFEHGHAPEGKALVPAEKVAVVTDVATNAAIARAAISTAPPSPPSWVK